MPDGSLFPIAATMMSTGGPAPPPPEPTGLFDGIPDGPPAPAILGPAETGIEPMTGVPLQSFSAPPAPPPTGLFDSIPDAPPGPPGQPSLGERFTANLGEGWGNTLAGATTNLIGSTLAGQQGPEATAQYQQQAAADQASYAAMPPWYEAPGVLGKVGAGAAALGGQLVGGALSPESLVGGTAGYGAVRAGEAFLPVLARAAAEQAAVQGGANVGAQGLNMAAGTQQEFSPEQVAESAAMGGAFGAAGPVAGKIVNKVAGVNLPVPEIEPAAVNRYAAQRETQTTPSTGLFDHIPEQTVEPTRADAQATPAAAAEQGPPPGQQQSPSISETPPAAAAPIEVKEPIGPAPELGPTENAGPDYVLPPTERAPALVDRPEPVVEPAVRETAPEPVSETVESKPVPTGVTRPPLGGVVPDRDFNEGTSPYRQVYRDAGHDPDLMVNRSLEEQNRVISDQLKSRFGFREVEINKNQDPKEVRDQLSNFYQNAHEMSATLGMPHAAIGLAGRLKFTTKPYASLKQALGSYRPGTREITIPGRSNSFAHEWTHAFDHYAAEQLANNPQAKKLLSQTRGMQDDPTRLAGKPVAPGSTAEAFAGVLRTIYGKDAATAAEALKAQMDARHHDPAVSGPASARLAQIESNFSKAARGMPDSRYWSSPAEMLARAHEAFVAHEIKLQGGDTRAVTKSDHSDLAFPQEADRDRVFLAFRDMHSAIQREAILGRGAGARPTGRDMFDPSTWNRWLGPPTQAQSGGVLRKAVQNEVQALKNFRQQAWEKAGFSEKDAVDPGVLTTMERWKRHGANLAFSSRGIMKVMIETYPKGSPARRALQQIADKLSPVEHVRSSAAAAERDIGAVYEQEVRRTARRNTNAMYGILRKHGLFEGGSAYAPGGAEQLSAEHGLMLRHVMTTGRGDNYIPDGATKAVPIPQNIVKAGGEIRGLMDREFDRLRRAGIDIGYTAGQFPRFWNDARIMSTRHKGEFIQDATNLHRDVVFDKDVENDPAKLLAAHDEITEGGRNALPQSVQKDAEALRVNLRNQDKLQDQIEAKQREQERMQALAKAGKLVDPAAELAAIDQELKTLQGKQPQLQTNAQNLFTNLHDPVAAAWASEATHHWWTRINVGGPLEFDMRGPSAKFTRARVLPPETDTMMRKWLHTDPQYALSKYFQATANKAAFARRFGVNGEILDRLLKDASDGGVHGQDIREFKSIVQTLTGHRKSDISNSLQTLSNYLYLMGSLRVLGRVAITSITEPLAAYARTESFRSLSKALTAQMGSIFGTADAKHRADLARALGLISNAAHDSILTSRTEAHYTGTPAAEKINTEFFRINGLTALTNAQRASSIAGSHIALHAWSRDLLSGNAKAVRNAAAEFRDVGVSDAYQKALAEWITAKGDTEMPSLADLETDGGRLWGHAVSNLVDQTIQEPLRVDKPLASQNTWGRFIFALQSFNYAFYHNIVQRTFDRHGARIKEGVQDARANNWGALAPIVGGAPELARAAAHVATSAAVIFAGTYPVVVASQYLFNPQGWARHEKEGDLHDWLVDMTVNRTGINGAFDPLVQAITGLKYRGNLASMAEGMPIKTLLDPIEAMLTPFVGAGSPNTNTAWYNAAKALYMGFGVPAAAYGLSALPGGPILTNLVYRPAGMFGSSNAAGDSVATAAVGPKGGGLGGAPAGQKGPFKKLEGFSKLHKLGEKSVGQEPALGTGVPIGLVDDAIAPLAGPVSRAVSAMPGALKFGLGAAAAGAGAYRLNQELSKWRP